MKLREIETQARTRYMAKRIVEVADALSFLEQEFKGLRHRLGRPQETDQIGRETKAEYRGAHSAMAELCKDWLLHGGNMSVNYHMEVGLENLEEVAAVCTFRAKSLREKESPTQQWWER